MGRKLSAREALSAGLVSTVVSADSEEAFLLQASLSFFAVFSIRRGSEGGGQKVCAGWGPGLFFLFSFLFSIFLRFLNFLFVFVCVLFFALCLYFCIFVLCAVFF